MPDCTSPNAWPRPRQAAGTASTKAELATSWWDVPRPETAHSARLTTTPGCSAPPSRGAHDSTASGLISPGRRAGATSRASGTAPTTAPAGCAWLGYFFVVPEGLAGPLRRGSWRRCWHRGPADGGAAGRRGRWRGAARPTRRPGPAPWADEPAGRAVVRASARWRAAPWRRGQPGAVGSLRPRHVPPARRQLRLLSLI